MTATGRWACAVCGQARPPFRRPADAPCRVCVARAESAATMAADRDRVVAAVLAVDPPLPAEAVAERVEQVTPQREQRRVLAGAVTNDTTWCTGSTVAPPVLDRLIGALAGLGTDRFEPPRCGTCGHARRSVGRDADGARICKACEASQRRRADCVDCGRTKPIGKRLDDGTALCFRCWRNRPDQLRECADCAEPRPVHAYLPDGRPVCPRCYMRRSRGFGTTPARATAVCIDCGRERFCVGITTGAPRCKRCYPDRTAPCTSCGRGQSVAVVWADRPYCDQCRGHILDRSGTCERCHQQRRIDPRNTNGHAWCSTCAGLPPLSVCTRCGNEARLWERGRCRACAVQLRLDSLLAAAPPDVAGQLAPLRAVAAADPRLIGDLDWFHQPTGRLLTQLFEGTVAVSHHALDTLGTRPAQHLRHLLVTAGVLPARDEALAGLERWLAALLDTIEHPDDRHIVDTYATWHVLRRRRARAAHAGPSGDATGARRTIRVATELLAWLRDHHTRLDQLTQADIDLWVASGPPSRRLARTFLNWAASRRIATPVKIHIPSHRHPATTTTADSYQDVVTRLVTDTTLPRAERSAGLLVALYAQPVSRIVRLHIDHVTTIAADHVTLALGRHHIELPPVLAELVTDLINDLPPATSTTQRWLFPGGHPGQPITADWLATRIANHGLPVDALRASALLELAAEVPAAFLADLLGLSPQTAVRWAQASGGEWTNYVATTTRGHRAASSPNRAEQENSATTNS